MRSPQHTAEPRLLKSSIFALAGLRPALSEHTEEESVMLREYATGARTIVEIGVAEGASAWEVRQRMAPDGDLYLIDPYDAEGRLGRLRPNRLVAHRLVNSVARGRVTWIEEASQTVALAWSTPIDFLFIDGDHAFEAVKADWSHWTPHLALGGHVALHDARVEAYWTARDSGPVRLLEGVRNNPEWDVVAEVDSLAVLRRSSGQDPSA